MVLGIREVNRYIVERPLKPDGEVRDTFNVDEARLVEIEGPNFIHMATAGANAPPSERGGPSAVVAPESLPKSL